MTVDELVKNRAHFDASVHVGGHPGEPWPEHKCLVLTAGGQTWLCLLTGDGETVRPVGSVREGLEIFAGELQAAIRELEAEPARP
jgi:hypothetical protein